MIVLEALVALLIVLGGVFGLVGSYGLVKLPDLMTRLHAPTKATTLGVGGVLVAHMLNFALIEGPSLHEVLVTLFLFLTAPVSANLIAKAWLHHHSSADQLPDSGVGHGWANFESPPDDGVGPRTM
jgi:multicomponent K+:H+ antiporter subunit G